MGKGESNIASTVWKLIEPTVREQGFEIWDVEYLKEGATWYLRITIDSENGVDLDGCERVHRAIDPLLDEADPIEDTYQLEVSSPGLERTIRLPAHYLACRGEKVEIRLFKPVDGSKRFVGILDTDDRAEQITVTVGSDSVTVPRAMIAKANVYFEF